ncbi:MAG: glycosyltransferase family 2 protein [Chitinivibrionia bacterium]|nr:glycosyltransferase family 2 protein [Chitinivibrionia bacterium]
MRIRKNEPNHKEFNAFFLNDDRIKNLTSYETFPNKETKNPVVRVFVMTYNNIGFARHNLNGILMQKTNFPFEICIQDDCSTDGTSDIVREYASKYPNIIGNIHPENLWGKIAFRNKFWENTKEHNCKYLAFCDGDDYWTDPYKLQIQYDFLENNGDFALCSGGWIVNNEFDATQQMCGGGKIVGFEYDFEKGHYPNYWVKSFTRMCRTDAIPEMSTGLKFKYFRDVHLAYFILTKGKGYFFSRLFGVYNKHQGGIYGGIAPDRQMSVDYRVYEELYRETRNKQVAAVFVPLILGQMLLLAENKEKQIAFYKEIIESFPELREEVNEIIFKGKQ